MYAVFSVLSRTWKGERQEGKNFYATGVTYINAGLSIIILKLLIARYRRAHTIQSGFFHTEKNFPNFTNFILLITFNVACDCECEVRT
jgi:hypothetical protein